MLVTKCEIHWPTPGVTHTDSGHTQPEGQDVDVLETGDFSPKKHRKPFRKLFQSTNLFRLQLKPRKIP